MRTVIIFEMKHYQIIIEQDEDGIYIGTVLGLQSCYADGRTIEELIKNVEQVVKLCERQKEEKTQSENKFIGVRDLMLQNA